MEHDTGLILRAGIRPARQIALGDTFDDLDGCSQTSGNAADDEERQGSGNPQPE
jgi:hypothetical protein